MACQDCGSKIARLRQGDLILCNRCFDKRFSQAHSKSQMYLNVTVAKNHLKHYEGKFTLSKVKEM